jgi:hypothetical protein
MKEAGLNPSLHSGRGILIISDGGMHRCYLVPEFGTWCIFDVIDFLLLLFGTGSHLVACSGLELRILLPQPLSNAWIITDVHHHA